jgi:predicted hydrocarbon binding protein
MNRQLPPYVIRICYDIIAEETANPEALARVLELAGLERYVAKPPTMNNTDGITTQEYEKLVGVVWQVFDPIQAREIFRRVAVRGFQNLTRSGVLAFAEFFRAFDAIGTKRERVALTMGRLTNELTHSLGNKHELRREGEDFILDIYDCPYCAEFVRGTLKPPETHVCHIPMVFYQTAFAWASGSPHTVQEISCRASSPQDYCRFKIFWNIALKKQNLID